MTTTPGDTLQAALHGLEQAMGPGGTAVLCDGPSAPGPATALRADSVIGALFDTAPAGKGPAMAYRLGDAQPCTVIARTGPGQPMLALTGGSALPAATVLPMADRLFAGLHQVERALA